MISSNATRGHFIPAAEMLSRYACNQGRRRRQFIMTHIKTAYLRARVGGGSSSSSSSTGAGVRRSVRRLDRFL